MTHDEAFLNDIRAAPDDDGPRLIYADWMEDNGQAERAEFIRAQIELARLLEDHPKRPGLAEREAELLRQHADAWTELAYLNWLNHVPADCPCHLGHHVCQLTIEGVTTRRALDRLPLEAPERGELNARLKALGNQAEAEHECHHPLFDRYDFRRGFIESVEVNELMFVLYPQAVVNLTVLRHLAIVIDENELSMGDFILAQLGNVLDRARLETLSISTTCIEDEHLVPDLVQEARLRELRSLKLLWLWGEKVGDFALTALAQLSELRNLRSLSLTICSGSGQDAYTEATLLELIRSERMPNLTDCSIYAEEEPELSPETLKLYQARFGRPRPDADRF